MRAQITPIAVSVVLLLGVCATSPACERDRARSTTRDCEVEARAFAAWLAELAAEGYYSDWGRHLLHHPHLARLRNRVDPETAAATRVGVASIVVSGAGVLTLSGEALATEGFGGPTPRPLPSLVVALRSERQEGPWKYRALMYPAARWAYARDVLLSISEARIPRVEFQFIGEPRQPPPPPSPIDNELAELIPRSLKGRPASVIDEEEQYFRSLYRRCPAALRVVQPVRYILAPPKAVAQDKLTAALVGCKCAVDFAALRAVHWAETGRPYGVIVGVPIEFPLAEDDLDALLTVPPETPWAEAHEALLDVYRHQQER